MTQRLEAIGDALERAADDDLQAGRRQARRRRRIGIGAVALAILVPSGALAAGLLSTEDVEQSIPAGTKFLGGTAPQCTVVRDGVEYRCTIKGAFKSEIDGSLKGTVEPTVDDTKHVNGGCRALTADGREWSCYIGQEAVTQKIVGQGFLGEYAPSPGVG
jgi:hypothetical protein